MAARITRSAMQEYNAGGAKFAYRLVALPEHGVVYVKNPKSGCSTLLLWLHRIHTGDWDFAPQGNIHVEHATPRPGQVGWRQLGRMLSGSAYRFTFVRDPARRVESAYRDKFFVKKPGRFRVEVQEALGLPPDPAQEVTFDQFVASLEAQQPMAMNPHWRPQHLNVMDGLLTYDFVGHLERFETDLATVRAATGLPDAPLDTRNSKARPGESLFDGRADLVEKVRRVYARDYELYGY